MISAQLDLNTLLMMDSFGHGSFGGRFGGDMLPLLALNGGLEGGDLTNYMLVDSLQHSGDGSGFLPLSILSGTTDIGGDLGNLWALNEFSHGSQSALNEILPLAAFGVLPEGTDLNQFWAIKQFQHGNDSILPLMTLAGQDIPTDLTQLMVLNEFSGPHRTYGRRAPHYYGRRAPVYGRAPVVATPAN